MAYREYPEEVRELVRYLRRHYNVLTRDVAASLVSLVIAVLALGIVLLSTPLIVAGAGGVALLTMLATFPPPEIEISARAHPLQCRVGDEVTIVLDVRASRGVGAALLVLKLPHGLQIVQGSNIHVLYKGLGVLEKTIVLKLRTTRSGVYEIGPVIVESYHIAGLGRVKRREIKTGLVIEVRPRLFKTKKTTRTRIAATTFASVAIARSRLLGAPSTDFKEIRRYVPGDPLKHINWKATARSGRDQPLVNEYERETLRRVIIVPDIGEITRFDSLVQSGIDYVYSLAFSLALSFIERGYIVYVYNPASGRLVRPRARARSLLNIWRECVSSDISEVSVVQNAVKEIEKFLQRARGGLTVIIVITYACPVTEVFLKYFAERIRSRRDAVLIVVDLDNETYVKNVYKRFGDVVPVLYRTVKDSYRTVLRRQNTIVLKADVSQSPVKVLRQILSLV